MPLMTASSGNHHRAHQRGEDQPGKIAGADCGPGGQVQQQPGAGRGLYAFADDDFGRCGMQPDGAPASGPSVALGGSRLALRPFCVR